MCCKPGVQRRDLFWYVSLLTRAHGPRCNSQRSPVKVHSFSPLEIPTLLEMHAGPTENVFTLSYPNATSSPYSSACSEHCLQYCVLNTPTKCTVQYNKGINYHFSPTCFGAYCSIFRENFFVYVESYCYICDYTSLQLLYSYLKNRVFWTWNLRCWVVGEKVIFITCILLYMCILLVY